MICGNDRIPLNPNRNTDLVSRCWFVTSKGSPYYTIALQFREICGYGIRCARTTSNRNRGSPICSGEVVQYGWSGGNLENRGDLAR